MSALRLVATLALAIGIVGILLPVSWLAWSDLTGQSLSINKVYYRQEVRVIEQPLTVINNTRNVQSFTTGGFESCIKITSGNSTTYKCER